MDIHSPTTRSPCPNGTLHSLVSALNVLCDAGTKPISPDTLHGILLRHPVAPGDCLTPIQREGRPDTYVRHVLHADPQGRYTVVAIVWRAGQRTAVHGHLTWCGYRVLQGNLIEEQFAYLPGNGMPPRAGVPSVVRTGTLDLPLAHVATTAAGRSYLHRLAHGGGPPAVSLHIYGVPCDDVCSKVNDIVDYDDQDAASI